MQAKYINFSAYLSRFMLSSFHLKKNWSGLTSDNMQILQNVHYDQPIAAASQRRSSTLEHYGS